MALPGVSVVIPTLNSGNTLGQCLKSIRKQDYPREKIEIIIADGGSSDRTLEIARTHKARIFPNRLKTGEAGKAVGLKRAGKEIVAFIDSDNILPSVDWMRRMVEPFGEDDIIASEPVRYTYRKQDGFITRYSALIGMNDPLCMFLGNYDRFNMLTGKWTEMPHEEQDRKGYIKVRLYPGSLPTIGANGFMIRRSALAGFLGDYLFDIDILHELLDKDPGIRIAKVRLGIIHVFSGSVSTFMRKQNRRIRDYSYYTRIEARKYPWKSMSYKRLLKFAFYSATLLPLLWQAFRGWTKKRDSAWFFHVPACWITLWIYAWGRAKSGSEKGIMSREGWRQ
jgi:glycosyltransferase involved in cell wall biosynthesis